MNNGVSDLWLREAIQGGLKGGRNVYGAEGCRIGMVRRVEKGEKG
jgi:hypothetical protein